MQQQQVRLDEEAVWREMDMHQRSACARQPLSRDYRD